MVKMLLNPLLHLRDGTMLLIALRAILRRMLGLVTILVAILGLI